MDTTLLIQIDWQLLAFRFDGAALVVPVMEEFIGTKTTIA